MYWSMCDCGGAQQGRVPRQVWMRLFFPYRRLFQCATCGRRALIPPPALQPAGMDTAPQPVDGTGQRLRRRTARRLLAAGLTVAVAAGAIGLALTGRNDAGRGAGPARALAPVAAHAGAACTRVHVYREGESLESIAVQELGAEWRWQEIAALNHDLIDRLMLQDQGLQPGMQLSLPGACIGG